MVTNSSELLTVLCNIEMRLHRIQEQYKHSPTIAGLRQFTASALLEEIRGARQEWNGDPEKVLCFLFVLCEMKRIRGVKMGEGNDFLRLCHVQEDMVYVEITRRIETVMCPLLEDANEDDYDTTLEHMVKYPS